MTVGRGRLVPSLLMCVLAVADGVADEPRPMAELKLPGPVLDVTPYGDGYLAACEHDLVLVAPDLRSFRTLATEKGHLWAVAVSPDRKRVAYGCDGPRTGGLVRVLDAGLKPALTLETPARTTVRALGFDPAGAVLTVSTFSDKRDDDSPRQTAYYDAGTGKQAFLPEHLGRDVVTTAKTPDGRLLILSTAGGPVRLVASDTYKDVAVLEHDKPMLDLAVSLEGRFLACYGIFTPVTIWDLGTHKLHCQVGDDTKWVCSAAVDGKAGLIATSAHDGLLRVWDLGNGKVLWERAKAHSDRAAHVMLSSSRKALVSLGYDDGTLRLWDLPADVKARFK